jgi:hypothetical protein
MRFMTILRCLRWVALSSRESRGVYVISRKLKDALLIAMTGYGQDSDHQRSQ